MPTFCYSRKTTGELVERFVPAGKMPPLTIRYEGKTFRRDMDAEHVKVKHTYGSTYPRWSDSAGVNPDQIPEQVAADKRLGVRADYDRETGQVKFESRKHEERYLKAHGLHHRNAYGRV